MNWAIAVGVAVTCIAIMFAISTVIWRLINGRWPWQVPAPTRAPRVGVLDTTKMDAMLKELYPAPSFNLSKMRKVASATTQWVKPVSYEKSSPSLDLLRPVRIVLDGEREP